MKKTIQKIFETNLTNSPVRYKTKYKVLGSINEWMSTSLYKVQGKRVYTISGHGLKSKFIFSFLIQLFYNQALHCALSSFQRTFEERGISYLHLMEILVLSKTTNLAHCQAFQGKYHSILSPRFLSEKDMK